MNPNRSLPVAQLSDEQVVRQVYPDAYIAGSYSTTQAPDDFDIVIRSTQKVVGSGHTPVKAWKSARSIVAPEVEEK